MFGMIRSSLVDHIASTPVKNNVSQDRGFMLIECLVATAIAAMAILVVLQMAESSINRHNYSMAVRNAHLEAESLLRSTTGVPDKEVTEVALSAGRVAVLRSSPFEPKGAIATALAGNADLYVVHVKVHDKKGRLLASMQALKPNSDGR